MNWHVYRKDDPSTWPEFDCPMLVCKWTFDYLYSLKIMYWDQNNNLFYYVNDMMEIYHCEDGELYYLYVGYLPKGYKVLHPIKCGCVDENGKEYRCPYGYDDDGYCMYEEEMCEYKKIVNEYVLDGKVTVWKEFEVKTDTKKEHCCILCGDYIEQDNLHVCDKCASEYKF